MLNLRKISLQGELEIIEEKSIKFLFTNREEQYENIDMFKKRRIRQFSR